MTVSSVGSSTLAQQLRQLQQSMFTTADADADGSLSLGEFQSIRQNVQGGVERPPSPAMKAGGGAGANFSNDTLRSLMSVQMLGSDAGSVLTSADADSDGLLSADEVSSALSANAPEQARGLGMEAKMADDMIGALDSDADGALSSEEIAAGLSQATSAMQGMRGPPPGGGGSSGSPSGSSGVFEALDTNQDGTVSAAELAAANTDSRAAATEAGAAAADLIAAGDTDGDEALSGFEFADLLNAARASSGGDSTSPGVLSGSSLTSDLMSRLLAQLDAALASRSGSSSTVTATV